jgi:hypothetical protein
MLARSRIGTRTGVENCRKMGDEGDGRVRLPPIPPAVTQNT